METDQKSDRQRMRYRQEATGANPLVSVIICNYNYGCFVAQAIESVFAQTYRHFELIVVDDGSTDNSREVIGQYADRLAAIFQSNGGQGAAFNSGFSRSTGEIICLLDADDYYHPQKLEKVVSAFQTYPEWVQLSHGWVTVSKDGVPMGGNASKRFSRGDVGSLLLRYGRYAAGITSGLCFRRGVLERVLPIPTQPKASDTYLTATVPFWGPVGGIDEPLMFYRLHGKNRRANTDNVPYFIKTREDTCGLINRAAAAASLTERYDLERDPDYLSYLALLRGGRDWKQAPEVFWLSMVESLAIGRSPGDTLIRLFLRLGCTMLPESEGRSLLRLGIRGYLRSRLPKAWT